MRPDVYIPEARTLLNLVRLAHANLGVLLVGLFSIDGIETDFATKGALYV